MAKKRGELFTGVLGPFVYRIVNGKQIVTARIKKGTMKQTQNTKDFSNTFGMAAKFAAALRKTLVIQLNGFFDDGMRNRLNGLATKILDGGRDRKSRRYHFERESFERLECFEFNLNSIVKDYLRVKPKIQLNNNLLKISLPALNKVGVLRFPEGALRCKITFTLSLLRFKTGKIVGLAESKSLMVPVDKVPSGKTEFSFSIPENCLYVVGMFLEYQTADKSGWKLMNNLELNPGTICSAKLSVGTGNENEGRLWASMIKLN